MTSKWRTVALQDVATIERDVVEATAIADGTLYVGLENIESGGNFLNVREVDAGELASSKFSFTPRHLLYGKLRPYLAKIGRPTFDGICSTDILPVLPGSDLDRDFLAHFLLRPESVALANSRATGANLPRLSPRALADLRLPLPPLAEQRRIADVLDRVESLRAQRRAALAQLDTLTQSIFLDMFGDPATNPKGWPVLRIGDVADVQGGLQVTTARENLVQEVPYLRVANVYRGYLNLAEIKTIRATDAEIARTSLLAGDMLIVEGHGNPDEIGRGALWDGSISLCVHQNHIIRARFAPEKVVPHFACEFLNSPGGRRHLLRAGKTTSGLNTISVSEVRGTPIALPPLAVQLKFAHRLNAVGSLRSAGHTSLAELDTLFAALQHRAFRGDL
jgi:type I restriction enzyme S subunit